VTTDPIIGTTVLNRYRVVARLAAGGMGVVYLARVEGAAGFAKPIVVKRILPEHTRNENMARLFIREAKILANLHHPNIVGVTDFGEEGGAYIMVLDYVRAYHLGLWSAYREKKGQRLPAAGAIHIMTKVLDALDYAHTLTLPDGTPQDIIHSDVSPSNILVDTDGQVKLLDFGIARMRGETTKSHDTASIRGKLAYLPIEALDGSPPTVATDVYACGVTLYELLAGKHPFQADDDTVTLARVIQHAPAPISSLRPEVPPELDAILARALSKDPKARFPRAKEFARELRRIQTQPEAEAAAELAGIAKPDYADMPNVKELGVVPLGELEDAWRNPPASDPRVSRVSLADSQPGIEFAPTLAPDAKASAKHAPFVSGGPPPKRNMVTLSLVVAGVMLAAGGIIAGIVVALRRPNPDDEPKLILVEHTATAATATQPIPPVPTTTTTINSAEPATTGTVTTSATKPATKPAQDPISAAFAKQGPQIEGCFRDHGNAVTPEISIKFSIDKDGAVQRADMTPADVASSPVGQCILGVAKQTKFPPQNAPITFSIPLRARRSP
jgi:serine/threonine-protein kinase